MYIIVPIFTVWYMLSHLHMIDGLAQVDMSEGNSVKNQAVGLLQAVSYLKGLCVELESI